MKNLFARLGKFFESSRKTFLVDGGALVEDTVDYSFVCRKPYERFRVHATSLNEALATAEIKLGEQIAKDQSPRKQEYALYIPFVSAVYDSKGNSLFQA